jgi:hypothetical protein
MTIYFLSHSSHGWCEARPPPPRPTALWEKFWWSDLTLRSGCKQKVPHNSLDCQQICGFTAILTSSSSSSASASSSTSHFLKRSLRKSKLTLLLGCLTAYFSRSLGCLKSFSHFHLSIFGHRSCGPSSLPDYHKNHLIWVDWSLIVCPTWELLPLIWVDWSLIVPLENSLNFERLLQWCWSWSRIRCFFYPRIRDLGCYFQIQIFDPGSWILSITNIFLFI